MRYEELTIEGRNPVMEAFRAGKPIDKLFVLDGCQDGPVRSIIREAKKLMIAKGHTYYQSKKLDRVPKEAVEELLGITLPDTEN